MGQHLLEGVSALGSQPARGEGAFLWGGRALSRPQGFASSSSGAFREGATTAESTGLCKPFSASPDGKHLYKNHCVVVSTVFNSTVVVLFLTKLLVTPVSPSQVLGTSLEQNLSQPSDFFTPGGEKGEARSC